MRKFINPYEYNCIYLTSCVELSDNLYLVPEWWTNYTNKRGETFTKCTSYQPSDIHYVSRWLLDDPYYTKGFYNCYDYKVNWQYVQFRLNI